MIIGRSDLTNVIVRQRFRELLDCIMFLWHTRPEFLYALQRFSQQAHDSSNSAVYCLEQCIRHIRITMDHTFNIHEAAGPKFKVVAFSDAT